MHTWACPCPCPYPCPCPCTCEDGCARYPFCEMPASHISHVISGQSGATRNELDWALLIPPGLSR
eukprot:3574804-Prymnesium_polylepis.1